MDGKKGKRAMSNGKVVKVSGPLVVATGLAEANMADVVRVGAHWRGADHDRGRRFDPSV